jgi:DNA-directed RNA polymerase subunit RPC12/RpoP
MRKLASPLSRFFSIFSVAAVEPTPAGVSLYEELGAVEKGGIECPVGGYRHVFKTRKPETRPDRGIRV